MNPLTDVTKWLSEHSILVSAYGMLTGALSKILQLTPNTSMIVSSFTDITLVFSFLITVFTVLIKGKEFFTSYFPSLSEKIGNYIKRKKK